MPVCSMRKRISGDSCLRMENTLSLEGVISGRFWFVLVVFVMCVDINRVREQFSPEENRYVYEIDDRKQIYYDA